MQIFVGNLSNMTTAHHLANLFLPLWYCTDINDRQREEHRPFAWHWLYRYGAQLRQARHSKVKPSIIYEFLYRGH